MSQVNDQDGQKGKQSRGLISALQQIALNPRFDRYRDKPWWRTETALVVGAVFAGVVSAMLSQASRTAYREQLETRFQTSRVVVAGKDLAAGTVLSKSHLGAAAYLKGSITKSMVPVENLDTVLGRSLMIDFKPGDPILLSAVTGADMSDRMAEKVPPGKRLFTLNITDTSAGLGFVRPGDHVDILTHMDLPGRGPVTFTVMQDVTLVSVGTSSIISGESLGGASISFFVKPEEFEVLSYSQSRGKFSLSLRNPKDTGVRKAGRGVDLNAFLDNQYIAPASGGGEFEVIEGGKKLESDKKAKK